jgi:hypothetical protein
MPFRVVVIPRTDVVRDVGEVLNEVNQEFNLLSVASDTIFLGLAVEDAAEFIGQSFVECLIDISAPIRLPWPVNVLDIPVFVCGEARVPVFSIRGSAEFQ